MCTGFAPNVAQLPPMLHSTTIGYLRNRSRSRLLCTIFVNLGGQTERTLRFPCTSPRGKTGEIGSTPSFSILSGSCDLPISRCAEASIFRPFHGEFTTVKSCEPLLEPCSQTTLSQCAGLGVSVHVSGQKPSKFQGIYQKGKNGRVSTHSRKYFLLPVFCGESVVVERLDKQPEMCHAEMANSLLCTSSGRQALSRCC
jgi:hypothetical protein